MVEGSKFKLLRKENIICNIFNSIRIFLVKMCKKEIAIHNNISQLNLHNNVILANSKVNAMIMRIILVQHSFWALYSQKDLYTNLSDQIWGFVLCLVSYYFFYWRRWCTLILLCVSLCCHNIKPVIDMSFDTRSLCEKSVFIRFCTVISFVGIMCSKKLIRHTIDLIRMKV